MHRDIKAEHILLPTDKDISQLKLADFSNSCIFDENNVLTEKIGTPYYIAPEILAQHYGAKCDIWSCGVVAYICLSGVPPFNGSSDQEILKRVRLGRFSFNHAAFEKVSSAAKDFISRLLTLD